MASFSVVANLRRAHGDLNVFELSPPRYALFQWNGTIAVARRRTHPSRDIQSRYRSCGVRPRLIPKYVSQTPVFRLRHDFLVCRNRRRATCHHASGPLRSLWQREVFPLVNDREIRACKRLCRTNSHQMEVFLEVEHSQWKCSGVSFVRLSVAPFRRPASLDPLRRKLLSDSEERVTRRSTNCRCQNRESDRPPWAQET